MYSGDIQKVCVDGYYLLAGMPQVPGMARNLNQKMVDLINVRSRCPLQGTYGTCKHSTAVMARNSYKWDYSIMGLQ